MSTFTNVSLSNIIANVVSGKVNTGAYDPNDPNVPALIRTSHENGPREGEFWFVSTFKHGTSVAQLAISSNTDKLEIASRTSDDEGNLPSEWVFVTDTELLETGVTAGEYGSAVKVPTFKVDAVGRITEAGEEEIPVATLEAAGLVALSNAVDSDDETVAATSKAVKTAYDLADAAIPKSQIGVAGGVVPLDDNAIIEAKYLPSYVDDVVEYDDYDALVADDPAEKDKIYVTKDNGNIYRYSGTSGSYIRINDAVSVSEEALKLATARKIEITGDATWEVNFQGDEDVDAVLTLADTGVTAGEVGSSNKIPTIKVDSKGRVTETGEVDISGSMVQIHTVTRTFTSTESLEIDLEDILGDDAEKYDLEDIVVNVRVEDTDSNSATFGYFINSEAVLAVGMKADGSKIKVYNGREMSVSAMIRVLAPIA